MMVRTAVILTVYNRKEITLQGLRSLSKAIEVLGEDYTFDIYMTDDGCTDGTSEAVVKEFPDVHIIQGDGKLYWSGGMRKAWKATKDSGINYDYYLWFNDDVNLYDNALMTMFNAIKKGENGVVITGAFCDKNGKPSYGGKTCSEEILAPNGECLKVNKMNGNLVLIPAAIYNVVGSIDQTFKHGYGDYDYGFRVQRKGYEVLLSPQYVGIANRHDEDAWKFFQKCYPLKKRLLILHDPKNTPFTTFLFEYKYYGLLRAIKTFIWLYFYTVFPKYN